MYYVDELRPKETRIFSIDKKVNVLAFKEKYQSIDYDLILKDKNGNILDMSTNSVGLSEMIEFTPLESGEYNLTVMNDQKECKGKWPSMLIAAELYNKDSIVYIKGKNLTTSEPMYETYYTLFLPKNKYSLVKILVPDSLDMYQARALCINENENWNDILHKKYDIEETKTIEGVEYSSSEKIGEDMTLKLSRNADCFIQLIGEFGNGFLEFKFKGYEEIKWRVFDIWDVSKWEVMFYKNKSIDTEVTAIEVKLDFKVKELKQKLGEVIPFIEKTRINSETGDLTLSLIPKTKSKINLICIETTKDRVCEILGPVEIEPNKAYEFTIPKIYDCEEGELYSTEIKILWKIEKEDAKEGAYILGAKKESKEEYLIIEDYTINGFCE